MKTKILSFLAVLTCLCFCASPVCCCAVTAPVVEEVLAETGFSEFISNGAKEFITDPSTAFKKYGGIYGLLEGTLIDMYKNAIGNSVVGSADVPEFTVGNFDIITGKYQMTWDIGKYPSMMETVPSSIFSDEILIECTMLLTDSWSTEYKDPATGVTYYSNALNISITRTNGSVSKYLVVFPQSFNYSRQVNAYNDHVTISAQSGCTLYSVDNGVIGSVIENGFYMEQVTFLCNNKNITTVNCNSTFNTASSVKAYPTGIYSYRGNTISSPGIDYPIDKDICHGVFSFYYPYSNGSGSSVSYRFNCLQYLTCGFYTTNNSNHQSIVNQYWVNNYNQNYYNYPITGGTTVTKDNYTDLNLPALKPVFDIDTNDSDWLAQLLALLPSLLDLLDGDLLPDLLDFLGRLVDFWGNMPDIGMEWHNDMTLNNNNYMDLELPSNNPPDSGGGGSGGDVLVTVDVNITRPLVSEVVTSYWLHVDASTETTATYPVAVVSAAPELWIKSDDVLNVLDLMPVYGLLALVGVAVAVLYKGV